MGQMCMFSPHPRQVCKKAGCSCSINSVEQCYGTEEIYFHLHTDDSFSGFKYKITASRRACSSYLMSTTKDHIINIRQAHWADLFNGQLLLKSELHTCVSAWEVVFNADDSCETRDIADVTSWGSTASGGLYVKLSSYTAKSGNHIAPVAFLEGGGRGALAIVTPA